MRIVRAAVAAVVTGTLAVAGLVTVGTTAATADTGDVHRITFPVQERVSYSDDWLAPRAGHRHQGNDLMGAKLMHEVAAVDGVISSVRIADGTNISGNMLTLKGDDGWFYYYIHINNDTPGTDDGLNPPEWRFAPGIAQGVRVAAGQFIAYMGDSGDAETTGPHLHFEVHRPDGMAVDPYPSLRLAQGLTGDNHCSYGSNPQPPTSSTAGGGYWLLGQDGGVFSYGNAVFYGSTGGMRLNAPVVGMASTPTGKGYWLVASDGGIFSFGDATFLGSTGAMKLARPIAGMATAKGGTGYWLVGADGGVFSFGTASYQGALPAAGLCTLPNVTKVASSLTGGGYWMAASNGTAYAFGDAKWYGDLFLQRITPAAPIVGMAISK